MGRQYTIEHYLERLDADPRGGARASRSRPTSSSASAARPRRSSRRRSRLLETVRYDQVFAAAYSPRPGTPATRLADDVPADDKRRRLNELLALQEAIGLERNRAWLGREVEVLVDAVDPPRDHEHDDARGHGRRAPRRRLPGRTRGNKLVHLAGDAGARRAARSRVRIDHAGPYALPRRARRRVTEPPRRSSSSPGATATGKTELAIELAEALRAGGRAAAIISADSRQVFRGLDIGTAKATAADRARVPHHGLDLVDPDQPFSVADFARHAAGRPRPTSRARGGVAILAGGTGLYLRAVARGLDTDALPERPRRPRPTRGRRSTDDGLSALVARLEALAPALAAAVDLRNPRRVVRALEIAELAGDAPRRRPRGYPGPVAWLGLERRAGRRTASGSPPAPAPSSTPV